jgi:pimeloyl-ACP methyl ester carboxylesterase
MNTKTFLPKIIALLCIFAPKLAAKMALKIFATPARIPRPESEMEMYHLSKQFFLTNGIAAFEWGNPTNPLVMLIHGWNGRGTQISAFAKLLVEKNFRVVALDGPGHGISPGKMSNPTHYAQFILNAQRELSPQGAHAIIAHSFGGGSTVLALHRGLIVKGVVLVASPAFYDRVVESFAKSVKLNKKAQIIFERLVTELAGISPRDLNVAKLSSDLKLPALIVHDQDDNAVNYISASAIAESWPQSKLLTTQGLGHRRILKDQKVIAEVCDFIEHIS